MIYSENERFSELPDYKFFCFNGIPKLCQVISNRTMNETIDYFTLDWERIDGLQGLTLGIGNSLEEMPRPKSLDDMIKMAKLLSKGLPFSRLDFYDIHGKAYFGEITLYPANGFGKFTPNEWNRKIGDWINLNVCI